MGKCWKSPGNVFVRKRECYNNSFVLDENDNKAVQVKKKKSLKERIAEKEEKRKKEIEEKKRKVSGSYLFKHSF